MFDKDAYMQAMYYCLPVPEHHPTRPTHIKAIEALGHCGVSADFTATTSDEFTLMFSRLSGQLLERILTNPHMRANVLATGRLLAIDFRN